MIVHDCCATLKTKVIVLICFEKELCKHACAKHFQIVLFTKIYDDRVYQALQVPLFSNVLFLHKKVQILSIIQDKYTFVLCASTRYLLCFARNAFHFLIRCLDFFVDTFEKRKFYLKFFMLKTVNILGTCWKREIFTIFFQLRRTYLKWD